MKRPKLASSIRTTRESRVKVPQPLSRRYKREERRQLRKGWHRMRRLNRRAAAEAYNETVE